MRGPKDTVYSAREPEGLDGPIIPQSPHGTRAALLRPRDIAVEPASGTSLLPVPVRPGLVLLASWPLLGCGQCAHGFKGTSAFPVKNPSGAGVAPQTSDSAGEPVVQVPFRTCGSSGPLFLVGTVPTYLRVSPGLSFCSLPAGDSLLPGHICPPPPQHYSSGDSQAMEGLVPPSPPGPTRQTPSLYHHPLYPHSQKNRWHLPSLNGNADVTLHTMPGELNPGADHNCLHPKS